MRPRRPYLPRDPHGAPLTDQPPPPSPQGSASLEIPFWDPWAARDAYLHVTCVTRHHQRRHVVRDGLVDGIGSIVDGGKHQRQLTA